MRETEMAIRLLRKGSKPTEVAKELRRSLVRVNKWRDRFYANEYWQASEDQSHRPKHCPQRLPESVRQAIREIRIEQRSSSLSSVWLGFYDVVRLFRLLRFCFL